jgi:hypothetical protein
VISGLLSCSSAPVSKQSGTVQLYQHPHLGAAAELDILLPLPAADAVATQSPQLLLLKVTTFQELLARLDNRLSTSK